VQQFILAEHRFAIGVNRPKMGVFLAVPRRHCSAAKMNAEMRAGYGRARMLAVALSESAAAVSSRRSSSPSRIGIPCMSFW
jgi:hypothetical protein